MPDADTKTEDKPTRSQRYWSQPEVLKDHADKRRKQYATDPAYRELEQKRSRERYASRSGLTAKAPRCNAILPADIPETITLRTLAALMGIKFTYVTRLVAKGLWPKPRFKDSDGALVYTDAQARRLAAIYAEHTTEKSYYRTDHEDTRAKLFAAMKEG